MSDLWCISAFNRLIFFLNLYFPLEGLKAVLVLAFLLSAWAFILLFAYLKIRGKNLSLKNQVKEDARLTRLLQKEKRISEDKCQHVFENTSDSIFIVSADRLRILEVNRAAQALTGYSCEELRQLSLISLCPFLKDKENEILDDPTRVQKILSAHGNISLHRKDHHSVLAEGTASVMNQENGQTIQVFLREVTERRHLEQQLRQAEKLSTLGQLISGVAHELNNPLAVISGYAQLLTMRPSVEEKIRKDLLKIQRESERASKIVQNFLSFARKQPTEKTNVNLNDLIKVSLELMDYDLRASGIQLECNLEPNLPKVFADPNQLEQVLLNIINNAVQAMEGSAREKELKVHTSSDHSRVKVSVSDMGHGIPPAILEKIFDPFFTTKEAGVGTGLGLSISYSIIKEHMGSIYAGNHSKDGAEFTIELPISHISEKTNESDDLSFLRKTPLIAYQRIFQVLVVDDESAIQDVFSELLLDYSCQVTGVGDGLQALKAIEKQHFDLVICDLKMPVMDGKRLFEKIKEINPVLVQNFIFITGDTNSTKTLDFLRKTGNRWIAKPFNFREIESILTEHFEKNQNPQEAVLQ